MSTITTVQTTETTGERIRVNPTKLASAPLFVAARNHWPEYLMEAAGLGIFMVSACAFVALLEHPASPVHQSIVNPFIRRMLVGIAMGLTAIGIIFSPWGK